MRYLKDKFTKLIELLKDINWLRISILVLLVATITQAFFWVSAVLESSKARVEYAETIRAYAGKLEEENDTVRKLLQESMEDPDVWGLRLISEIIIPRVNISSSGLAPGREKIICEASKQMIASFGEVLVNDEKATSLSPNQRSFIFKLLQAEAEYINNRCKKHK